MALQPISFPLPIYPRQRGIIEEAFGLALSNLVQTPFTKATERRAEERTTRELGVRAEFERQAERRKLENDLELTRRKSDLELQTDIQRGNLRELSPDERGAFIAEGLNPDGGTVYGNKIYHSAETIQQIAARRQQVPDLIPVFERIYGGLGISDRPYTRPGAELPVESIPQLTGPAIPLRDPLLAGEAARAQAVLPLAIDVMQIEEQARTRREASTARQTQALDNLYRNVDPTAFIAHRIKDTPTSDPRRLTYDEMVAFANLGAIAGMTNSADPLVRSKALELKAIADRLNTANQEGRMTMVQTISQKDIDSAISELSAPSSRTARESYAEELLRYDLLRRPNGNKPDGVGEGGDALLNDRELLTAMVILRQGPFGSSADLIAAEQSGLLTLSPRTKGWLQLILYQTGKGRTAFRLPGADPLPAVWTRLPKYEAGTEPPPSERPTGPTSTGDRETIPGTVTPPDASRARPSSTGARAPLPLGPASATINIAGSESYKGLYDAYFKIYSVDPGQYNRTVSDLEQAFTDPEAAASYFRVRGVPEYILQPLTQGDATDRRLAMSELRRAVLFNARQAWEDALAGRGK